MSRDGSSGRFSAGLLIQLMLLLVSAGIDVAQAQYYRPGQIVTNFTVYARRPFTNMAGRVFSPTAAVRLSDFAGYVLFAEFFDPT